MNELVRRCYEILGLRENASREEVLEAFNVLKTVYQRDPPGSQEADGAWSWERLKEITWARDTLLDSERVRAESTIPERGRETAADRGIRPKKETPPDQVKIAEAQLSLLKSAREPVAAGRATRSVVALAAVTLFLVSMLCYYGARASHQQVVTKPAGSTKAPLPPDKPAEQTRGSGLPASEPVPAGGGDIAQLLQDVKKAVVTLRFSGRLGSGFLVTPDGYIATNGHVVSTPRGVVQFSSGETTEVNLVKFEPDKDFALLKTDSFSRPFLKLGDSNVCREGDTVFAVGSPRGLDSTFTKGIVSAKNRQIPQFGFKFIQTDAAINQGNSGGPLINTAGEVIGINTLTVDKMLAEGLNFAIPINEVKALIEDGQRLTDAERAQESARLGTKLMEPSPRSEMSREDMEREEKRQSSEYQERMEILRKRLDTMQKREALARCLSEARSEAEETWNEQCQVSRLPPGCRLPERISHQLNIKFLKAQTECIDRNPK